MADNLAETGTKTYRIALLLSRLAQLHIEYGLASEFERIWSPTPGFDLEVVSLTQVDEIEIKCQQQLLFYCSLSDDHPYLFSPSQPHTSLPVL